MNRRFLRLRLLLVASCRYAWILLKRWVKALAGRGSRAGERERFLRRYILHLSGLRPIRAITCVRRSGSEGAGSQAHLIVNAIHFARLCGLTYVHTPFVSIHHADRPMREWVEAWEALFDLGAGEVVRDPGRHEAVNYCYGWVELEACFGWRDRREESARRFKTIIPELRRKYYRHASPRVTEEVTVAVHVRRGDVTAGGHGYFTATEIVLRTVTTLRSILDAHEVEYRIRVYSQGDAADFAELSPLGVELCLDADAIWTMREMIEADVLVMARGFFSYYAALVSDGIKIFEPREIPLSGREFLPSWVWMELFPEDDWIPRDADGSFDRVVFERRLSILLRDKTA